MTDTLIRVLYVDDDVALVRLVQKTLSRRGFEVTHAMNAEEALGHIASGSTQVIALDHYLATGTGLDFLARLASGENSPPVVYVTGSSEMNVAVAALKAGAADFVPTVEVPTVASLRTRSCCVLVAPRSSVVRLTLLIWPRLNTPPTPLPAMAPVAIKSAAPKANSAVRRKILAVMSNPLFCFFDLSRLI